MADRDRLGSTRKEPNPGWSAAPPRGRAHRGARRLLPLGLLALSGLVTPRAWAQDAAPAPDPAPSEAPTPAPPDGATVSAPRPLSTPVDYPPAGTGDAEVVVELVISPSGEVADVTSATGPTPFAEAARSAATDWRFEPALRAGTPVSAKILFLVRFEHGAEPSPEQAPAADARATEKPSLAPNAPRALGASPIAEIVVRGETQRQPPSRTFSTAEVENLPGAFGDPLRAIEVMPGVTPIVTGLPIFFVRGAPPGNVGFFFDEIRIPLLYHAFLGPSVIHPAMLSKVDLYAGPMPLRYGRFAGAAVDAALQEPLLDSPRFPWRGEAEVRLVDAGVYVEAPFAEGNGYAALAGRYSYTALLLTLLSQGQRVDYWDYQGLVGYHLTRKDTLSVLAFGAYDYADTGTASNGGTEFHRIDLRYQHEFSERTRSRVAATWGRDRTRSSSGFVSDDSIAGRFRVEHEADGADFRLGGDISLDRYELDVDPAVEDPLVFTELFPTRDDLSFGGYAEVTLWPLGRVSVTPGVRADVYQSLDNTEYSVDPRVRATYRLTPTVRTHHALGTAHQSPNFVPNIPGAQVGGLPGGLQKSLQWESSVDADLFWALRGSVGVFINQTRELSDPIGLSQSLDIDEDSAERRALGRAAGVELFLERPLTRRLGGIVSYTYSWSSRSLDTVETVPGYDRPHVFNGALSYDFGSELRASAKLALASGIPGRRVTPEGEFVFDGSRSQAFVRLDAKLSKRWRPTPHFWWGSYLEVLNATHGVQVARRTCTPSGCRDEGTGPITIPSVGLEAGWH